LSIFLITGVFLSFIVFPLPQPPCKSTCNAFVKYCTGTIPDESLPDCDAKDSSDEPEYPEKKKKFFVNGATFNIPCNRYEGIDQIDSLYDEDKDEFVLYDDKKKPKSAGKRISFNCPLLLFDPIDLTRFNCEISDRKKLEDNLKGLDIDPVVCPFPLERNKKYEFTELGDAPCMTTCPNPGSYSEDTWEKIKKEKLAFSVISLALDIWVLLTLITLKERRLVGFLSLTLIIR
jgi:hypothetical protein